jgi:hypothetical protein
MALSANRDLPKLLDQEIREFPVVANAVIYRGALLSIRSTGYVGPLAAGEQFAGIAYEEKNATGAANGAKKVRAYVRGSFQHALSGAAVTDLGDALYASADDTVTKTSGSNTFVGKIIGFVDSATVLFDLDTAFGQIAAP